MYTFLFGKLHTRRTVQIQRQVRWHVDDRGTCFYPGMELGLQIHLSLRCISPIQRLHICSVFTVCLIPTWSSERSSEVAKPIHNCANERNMLAQHRPTLGGCCVILGVFKRSATSRWSMLREPVPQRDQESIFTQTPLFQHKCQYARASPRTLR